ncbi:MAG TPA: terminase TerL endonuclease subunit [Dongiaceae bacterium]|nr:terminase TerL endonuclease subunit [Dongiaceae bacterium]
MAPIQALAARQAPPGQARPSASSTEELPPLPNGAPEGTWFDHKAAEAACAFFPAYLRHTEGEWIGKPFHLAPWQRQIVRAIFGWKLPDGTRLIRIAYIEVPRKNGKTEFAAGLALLLLVGDGEGGGQGYAMAVDKDQAKIAFRKAAAMASMSPAMLRHVEVFRTSVFCPELMASFKPISSAPGSKHGFSPSFAVADEIHEWRDGELAEVIHEGTGARRQPLEVYITTAGVKGRGYGWEMHDRALKVLDGTNVEPSFFALIYAAGEDDDWTDEAVWAKANPNLGISPKIEFLRAECAAARENPRLENRFRRYYLNQWTEQTTRWLQIEKWDACTGPIPWQELRDKLKGRVAYGGVDLSAKIDLSAQVMTIPPVDGDPFWYWVPRIYIPEGRVEFAERRDQLPYARWIREGALIATPGDVMDYGFIERDLMDDASHFVIREVAFDAWNALQFATNMMGEGMTMVDFRQGFKSMSEPFKELERLVIATELRHGRHPVLREMAKAVSVTTDPAGNIKPDKSKSTLRIDGIVAGGMGIGRAIVQPADMTMTGADIMAVM